MCVFVWSVNKGHSAVPCAYSYILFEPEDQVMKENLLYYEAYSEQWGLQPEHFTPRTVRQETKPDNITIILYTTGKITK